jgi:hypothetical protein
VLELEESNLHYYLVFESLENYLFNSAVFFDLASWVKLSFIKGLIIISFRAATNFINNLDLSSTILKKRSTLDFPAYVWLKHVLNFAKTIEEEVKAANSVKELAYNFQKLVA